MSGGGKHERRRNAKHLMSTMTIISWKFMPFRHCAKQTLIFTSSKYDDVDPFLFAFFIVSPFSPPFGRSVRAFRYRSNCLLGDRATYTSCVGMGGWESTVFFHAPTIYQRWTVFLLSSWNKESIGLNICIYPYYIIFISAGTEDGNIPLLLVRCGAGLRTWQTTQSLKTH